MKKLFSRKRKSDVLTELGEHLGQLDEAHLNEQRLKEQHARLTAQISEMTKDMHALKATIPLLKKDLKIIDRSTKDAKDQTGKILPTSEI